MCYNSKLWHNLLSAVIDWATGKFLSNTLKANLAREDVVKSVQLITKVEPTMWVTYVSKP
jgi:hypothetical protein